MQLFDLVLNYFHASDYIFIMAPWESLSQGNNGSSIIKQLALIAIYILEYIYVYIYIHIYINIYVYIYICIYIVYVYIYIICIIYYTYNL